MHVEEQAAGYLTSEHFTSNVHDGREVAQRVSRLRNASRDTRTELVAACARHLEVFRLSRQLAVLDTLLTAPPRSAAELTR